MTMRRPAPLAAIIMITRVVKKPGFEEFFEDTGFGEDVEDD